MAKVFNKKRESPRFLPREEKPAQEPKKLVLIKNAIGTSVFFHDKEIIAHKDNKAFAEIIKYEKTTGKKQRIAQKTVPLCCEKAEQTEKGIEMLFSAKGHSVRLDIKEEEKQLHIKIKKESDLTAVLYFPRGTKGEIPSFVAQKRGETNENALFYTKTPNFSTEGFFYNLKTAKGWSAEINDTDIIYKIRGEKAKLFVVKAGDAQENIKFYFSQDSFPETRVLEKGIYFTTDADEAEEKIERLKKNNVQFDGVVFALDLARLEEYGGIARNIKKQGKEIILKLKPYLPVKLSDEINHEYLVKDKSGNLLIEEIDNQKYYAINLACKHARRWQQNQIRNYLDLGTKGIIAECGFIDEERACLPAEEKFCYAETWYILWQRLVREVVDEYPNRILLLRHNGAKSPKYGALMTDEASWSDITNDRIKKDIERYAPCGMGDAVITEVGGIKNSGERAFADAEKWFLLCRKMPLIIFGRVPEKVIKKYFYLIDKQ